jgi:hypothetical protein
MVATKQATPIFPHQLYKQHPAVKKKHIVYLIEETLSFLPSLPTL